LNTMRQSLQLKNPSYWNVNSRWESKAKKNKQSQRHPWPIAEPFRSSQKRRYLAETCETRMNVRVSLNANPFKWTAQNL